MCVRVIWLIFYSLRGKPHISQLTAPAALANVQCRQETSARSDVAGVTAPEGVADCVDGVLKRAFPSIL